MRNPILRRSQQALAFNSAPVKELVPWENAKTLAVKWTFPEETVVVGFPQNDRFILVKLVVPRKLQRKGIGSRILLWLKGQYKNIEVQQVQDSAIGFWEKALTRKLITSYTQNYDFD